MNRLPAASAVALALVAEAAAAQVAATPSPPAGETAAPLQAAAPAPAQPADAADAEAGEDIVVVGGRPPGAIVSDIKPELVLNPADIRAYGASNLQDLLTQLSPQTTSGRGRGGEMPVVLINGRRTSGFQEFRSIPPEAIVRVEVLPEETALAYGYRADQRVVNFVLRPRFRATTVEGELGGPTAGGRTDLEFDASHLRLNGDQRLLLDLSYERSTALLESERDIIQSPTAEPLAIAGNFAGATEGAEIDPALSALAGQSVTIAGVPGSAATRPPTLAEVADTAGQPNSTGIGRYRTLTPATEDVSAGVSLTRPIGSRTQATLSARLTSASSEALQGLARADLLLPAGNPWSPFATDSRLIGYAAAPGALSRTTDSWTGRLAAAFNGDVAGWRWALTASHDHDESRTITERGVDLSDAQQRLLANDPAYNPYAENALNGPLLRDRATSNSDRSLLEATANGKPFSLPAGAVSTSFKAGLDHRQLDSFTQRGSLAIDSSLARTQAEAQASIDVPIASRRNEVLSGLGELSANANAAIDHYSDFGDLLTWGGGLTWRPIEPVQILASYTSEEGAPSIQQLGNPLITTPNVRVFDYVTGQTVEITRLDGGNASLGADHRQTFKLGGRVQPISGTDFSLQADYVRTRIDDPIAGFPTATAEIEAAFPERFLRGSAGQLLLIDNRPVNFARSDRSELRWGINFSERLEPTKAEREAIARRRAEFEKRRQEAEAAGKPIPGMPAWMQQRPAGAPGGQGAAPGTAGGPPGSGGPRGFGGGGGGFGEGRLQLSLFHSWRFTDTILIRDGVPELDLLNGSATGSAGGTPRHLVEARAGLNKNGLGARLSLNWQSGTEVRVDPGGPPSNDDLSFSSLTTVNLRLFADLGQRWSLVRKAPWLRGTRVSVGIDNIFDDRIDVRDRSGATPLNYQSDLMDPIGRRVEVSVRKLLF